MKNLTSLILLFFISCYVIVGQNLFPPIHNYKIFDYNAASKNWGLATNKDGELFSANNAGLLHFNGEEWKLNALPSKTTIRSVAAIDDKIYTGSYEEFGFWKKDSLGVLKYTSLTHLIKNHVFTSEEFWQIIPYNNAIVFRSFSKVYVYKNNKITVVKADIIVNNIAKHNSQIIVAGGDDGLFYLEGDTLEPLVLKNNISFVNKTVVDMVSIKEGLLIGTKLNGCYLIKNNEINVWGSTINDTLKQHQLNKIMVLNQHSIAFGTIKNGLFLYNNNTKTYKSINREVGLQNNTILAMVAFKNQLWLGLDNGIDHIQLDHPITYYTDFTGVLGTVYDIALYNNKVYLGSNTGLYYVDNDVLHFVKGTQGHVWDIAVVNNELFCGHNTGTFKLNKDGLVKVSNISGGYQIEKIPEDKSSFLQGTYTGIAKYSKDDINQWTVERLKGFNLPVKKLCFENSNTLWVAHPYKGFYKLKLNSTYDSVISSKEYNGKNAPNKYNVKLYNIKNQIVFYSQGEWFKYDPILDKIVTLEEFSSFKNNELLYYNDDHFWFIDNENSKKITYTNFKEDNIIIENQSLKKRIIPEAENIIKVNDSTFYFTLVDGYSQINFNKLNNQLKDNNRLPTPKLVSFTGKQNSYPIHTKNITLPFKDAGNISIKIASSGVMHPKYYYSLDGKDAQFAKLDNGFISFQNLSHGSYTLEVYGVGIDNKKSVPNVINFTIKAPWYLSGPALLIYFLLVIAAIILIRKYNKYKLNLKHNKLKERMQKEQDEKIALLEKEKLAKEVKLKQKELANTTLNIAKKNEIILDLKNLLTQNKDKFPNQQRYKSFMKRLNNSVNNKEDWKRFEMNFKELHSDFFENLLKEYPKLTPKDLKLCAYLKMNLSTKEIAPLMAITVRGVEIHRYRLRKKLNIDSSENISNFLITFK